jgi:hypothetical protein
VARGVADLQEVLASLATRGGQRLVTYLRLAEVKPPSRLPLTATAAAANRPPGNDVALPATEVPRPGQESHSCVPRPTATARRGLTSPWRA